MSLPHALTRGARLAASAPRRFLSTVTGGLSATPPSEQGFSVSVSESAAAAVPMPTFDDFKLDSTGSISRTEFERVARAWNEPNNDDVAYRYTESPVFQGSRVRKSPFFPSMLRHGLRDCTVYNKTLMPVSWDNHSNLDEYWSLVNDCIIWDVSCQRQVEFKGPDANKLAQYLSSRDLSKFKPGQAKYVRCVCVCVCVELLLLLRLLLCGECGVCVRGFLPLRRTEAIHKLTHTLFAYLFLSPSHLLPTPPPPPAHRYVMCTDFEGQVINDPLVLKVDDGTISSSSVHDYLSLLVLYLSQRRPPPVLDTWFKDGLTPHVQAVAQSCLAVIGVWVPRR